MKNKREKKKKDYFPRIYLGEANSDWLKHFIDRTQQQ